MPTKPSKEAIEAARAALRELGKEDLIYSHHGGVHAHPKAYEKLAEFFEEYAKAGKP